MGKILDKNNEMPESDLIPKGSLVKFTYLPNSTPSIGSKIEFNQLCIITDVKSLEECCQHAGVTADIFHHSNAQRQTYIIYILGTNEFAYYNCIFVKEYTKYEIIS